MLAGRYSTQNLGNVVIVEAYSTSANNHKLQMRDVYKSDG
jgi:hypothetical protein